MTVLIMILLHYIEKVQLITMPVGFNGKLKSLHIFSLYRIKSRLRLVRHCSCSSSVAIDVLVEGIKSISLLVQFWNLH